MRRTGDFWLRALVALALTPFLADCAATPTDGDVPSSTARLLWHTDGIGLVLLPGVDGDNVYAMGTDGKLYRFSRSTGALETSADLATPGIPYDVQVRQGQAVLAIGGQLLGVSTETLGETWRFVPAGRFGGRALEAGNTSVFATIGTGDEVASLSPQTGERHWTSSVLPPDSLLAAEDDLRLFTPTLDGEHLAVSYTVWRGAGNVADRGGIAVLDAATGARRWAATLPVTTPSLSTLPVRPAIGNGIVAVTTWEGFVYAYDVVTGALKWRGATARGDTAGPITQPDIREVAISGGVVVGGSGAFGFAGYDAASGRVLWRVFSGAGGVYRLYGAPRDHVLAVHFTGGLTLLHAPTGQVRWQYLPRSESERINGVRLAGDTVFGTSATGGLRAWELP